MNRVFILKGDWSVTGLPGISDEKLAELVMALRDDDRLCIIHEEEQTHEPRIICSLGLAVPENSTP